MRRIAPWVILVVVGLAYPVAVLAGGGPRFPSRDECIRPATGDSAIEAVFGRYENEREAVLVRDRALTVGFEGVRIARDGCGHVKVVLEEIPSLDVGREFAENARGVGFDVTLEQAG